MKNTFTFHRGRTVPLDRDNIDTDQIIPKQFLKSIKKSGFGPNLFDAWRYEDEGFPGQDISQRKPNKEFILNQERFNGADILISKKNFGCGSSREHAPIALKAAGISAVIAPTFARIFYRNSFNMGLPIFELKEADEINEGDTVRVDMDAGEVINITQAKTYKFSPIPEFMQELVDAGGLIEFAKKEMSNK